MKASILLVSFACLSSVTALPAEIHDRGFPFSFPGFPRVPAQTATSIRATTTRVPISNPTPTYPATTKATTSGTPTTSKSTKAPTPTAGSGTGSTGGSSENGIVNGECKDLTVIFARGTGESGNVGTVSGPPMFKALRSSLGSDRVTVQGVDYPASQSGNMNQGADGGPTMASLVRQALSQCPSTKIVLSGYSQGGMVVHNAVEKQGVSPNQISAVVLFGDPMSGRSVGGIPASKVLQICASGDSVCDGSGTYAITQAHMSYGKNAQEAADFIMKTAGLS